MHQEENRRIRCRGLTRTSQRQPQATVYMLLSSEGLHMNHNKPWRHIMTCEGFMYLAVVIDLNFCKVVGWAMQSRQATDLVLRALVMPVCGRPKPKTGR